MNNCHDQIDIKQIFEDEKNKLVEELEELSNPSRLNIHSPRRSTFVWEKQPDIRSLFAFQDIPVAASLEPVIHPVTDEITGWAEKIILGEGKTNDLSMKRPPLPPHLATRGNPSRLPFLPACFLEETTKVSTQSNIPKGETFMGEALLCRDPILNLGLDFEGDGITVKHDIDKVASTDGSKDLKYKSYEDGDSSTANNETDDSLLISAEDNSKYIEEIWDDEDITENNKATLDDKNQQDSPDESIIEPLAHIPILNISTHKPAIKPGATEWVEILDTSKPVEDFEKKIPNMAYKYPFELDTFQKLAILKLEEQGHVFVAAHTSAGKTVVAEYAIALSLKHCTRIIYTSPVKALSNQKYREFSTTFGDVGLLTGDIQINTTASCLVMTTEILRSMLYYGADVIRDLEYVIFDEVHYINDTQRGYVWEEVLILLPAHCGIVMLSATVPNTLEFADWVGRTKKRKVYVVSTTKRPVALCHYLYTGSGGSTKNDRFLVLGKKGEFVREGYNLAVESLLKSKKKKGPQRGGGKGGSNIAQEKTMWIGLIDHLRRHDKLPVVVFILSRKRCDITAEKLMSLDLTTAKEKSRIHVFIQACLKKLNISDKKLPQVTTLQTLLSCGIGIHHSGILPILKEVVEMLFQLGLVKILFATETFAVGVNMPARTVVFDSITKYDGLNWRLLQTSEYIQMAGRAGRRGLDDTGTVVILCKKEVPPSSELINMMLGKPSKLSSQFRLTYATMLGLLRVTNLSIENMMKNSFREFGVQSKTSTHKAEIQKIYKKLSEMPKTPNYDFLGRVCDLSVKYHEELSDIMPFILPQKSKYVSVGAVIVLCYEKYAYQFGLILGYSGARSSEYRVLVLEFDEAYYSTPPEINNKDLWYAVISQTGHCFTYSKFYTFPKHSVITIKPKHIVALTKKKYKNECDKVLNDYELRQLTKTKTEPSSACVKAVNVLYNITMKYYSGSSDIEFVDLIEGLKINKGEILESLHRVNDLQRQITSAGIPCTHHNFYNEFPLVFQRKQLEWNYDKLDRLLSSEEMSLSPEYQRRLEVLKELRYIDAQNHVAIKGRVACELGKNELMITEIVFRNILTNLEPAEIAALLSCLVVEARIQLKNPQTIDPKLEEKIIEVQYIDEDLSELEKKYLVGCDDPTGQFDRLNFGLVQVIYEWAKGKPFCDVIKITDVQEGIIVHSIQKLHEVLMNVRDVAKIIGDPVLQSKMDEASLAIKRDIVFVASLYTQDDINTNFVNFSKNSEA